ncbi:copper resistance CopC/CopD family protein [Streptomyces sp. HC307]|uniref:copper resistance CopC/CopD family protein n=1 Tax=Streptomyces flavusporus TaxID=3385496 RepID=UPI00391710BD
MGLRDGGQRDDGDHGAHEHPRRLHRLVLLGAVLVLLLLGGAGPASAHAGLGSTDPRDGTVLDSAPRHITLTFTESVGLLDDSVRVIAPDNRPLRTSGAAHVDGRSDTVRLRLPADLEDGTYTVAWRVVSADSHPVSGAFIFSVGEPSATTVAVTAPAEDPAATSLYNIARYCAYGGLALLIGVLVFTAAVLGRPSKALRRLIPAACLTLLVSTTALLLLRGPYERGTGLADALDPAVLRATLTSRPGLALLARLALLAGAFLLVRRSWRRPHAVLGVPLALGLALTWAAAEHASAGIQVPVAITSSVLHLLAMAVWLGGLTALLTVLYRAPQDLTAPAVTRFSRLAFVCVAVLTVTGVYQSWRGLGSFNALTGTTYGRLLLAKLAAVTLLLAAAAVSRRWTSHWAAQPARTAAAERVPELVGGRAAGVSEPVDGAPVPTPTPTPPPDGDPHRRALRRSVLVEFVTGVLVLVITTLLTVTLPGRAASESAAAQAAPAGGAAAASSTVVPFDVGTPNGRGRVQVELSPGRVGRNQVQAVVFGSDGGLSTVPELRMTFTLRAQDVGPIDARLEDRGGYWATDTLRLPLAGTWTMRITVRTTEIDQVTVEKDVRVG